MIVYVWFCICQYLHSWLYTASSLPHISLECVFGYNKGAPWNQIFVEWPAYMRECDWSDLLALSVLIKSPVDLVLLFWTTTAVLCKQEVLGWQWREIETALACQNSVAVAGGNWCNLTPLQLISMSYSMGTTVILPPHSVSHCQLSSWTENTWQRLQTSWRTETTCWR